MIIQDADNTDNNDNNFKNIERMTYGSTEFGSSAIGAGAMQSPRACPISLKFVGDTVTLQATPNTGTGPYYVEFRKNGIAIDPLRLVDEFGSPSSNPIIDALENVQITRIYTLDYIDVSGASTGTIDFSVFVSDSCPIAPKTCSDLCIINIGCMTPVCNFVVS